MRPAGPAYRCPDQDDLSPTVCVTQWWSVTAARVTVTLLHALAVFLPRDVAMLARFWES